jgi:Uma2 family endonuclease
MAESDFQRDPLIYAVKALHMHFAQRPDVYVSGNLLIYYVEGDPYKSIAPDVFVVFGVPKYRRPIYKVWEEGKGPDVVIEITSKTTRKRDEEEKPIIYRDLHVQEYFQYDPTGDYLTPPLRGRRLDASNTYHPIPSARTPNGNGSILVLPSQVLDLELHLEGDRLRLFDPASQSYLLSHEEEREIRMQEMQARTQAEARAQAEMQARTRAEARAKAAETRAQTAEAHIEAARAAQQQLEERLKAMEEEMRRMRERGDQRE